MLDGIDETLNDIAFLVLGLIVRPVLGAIAARGYYGLGPVRLDGFDEFVAVVGLVGDDFFRLAVFDQRGPLVDIMNLSWSQ